LGVTLLQEKRSNNLPFFVDNDLMIKRRLD
jgi:hypothetical protein